MKKVPLHQYHEGHARMVEFAGFHMPLLYSSIEEEHVAVREDAGIFDISHMGRALISGPEAQEALNYVTVNDLSELGEGDAHYTMMCNEGGGVVDDMIVYRLRDRFLAVYNAATREKDEDWIRSQTRGYEAELDVVSDETCMFAVQGPGAEQVVEAVLGDLDISRFEMTREDHRGREVYVSRTGYTGEDGFELILFSNREDDARHLWESLLEKIRDAGGTACGLGARDTLRLEAGFCLYGNDLTDSITPLEADLGWVVKFQQDEFVGKEALQRQKGDLDRIRTGLVMVERGVPRKGYKVFDPEGLELGEVSSGSYSPLLEQGIAMAYVDVERADTGGLAYVGIRDKRLRAKFVDFPFYDQEEYGWKRKEMTQ